MSDYRNNNNGRDSGKPGTMRRLAYQGTRQRRKYVIKRPVYKQPIVWILVAAVICVFIICGSLLNWGRTDNTDPVQAVSPGVTTGALNPTNAPGVSGTGTVADASESPEPTATPTATPQPSPTPNNGPDVWDTTNGSYFHYDETCQSMKGATQESMLSAYNRGLQPCPVCVTSEEAISERPDITVKALTTLPGSLGNIVIQDPQVFDIYDVKPQLGKLSGSPALMVTATTTGNMNLLLSKQADVYTVKARAILTGAGGSVIWDVTVDPTGYSEAGLDMPRDLSFVGQLSTEDTAGAVLTILVYAPDGFTGVDADMAVLGMYQTTLDA